MFIQHLLRVDVALVLLSGVLAVIGTLVAYRQQKHTAGKPASLIGYVWPEGLLRQRALRQDLGFILANKLVSPFVVLPLVISGAAVANVAFATLGRTLGVHNAHPASLGLILALLAVALVFQDFLAFSCHSLLHRMPALWDAHKVHHTANFLSPLTRHRTHMMEHLFKVGVSAIGLGGFFGLAAYVFRVPIGDTNLLAVDTYVLIDLLCLSPLRHSHIPLSYGRFERYVISPAQHQIHHGLEERYWGRNLGDLFACWDRMAGSFSHSEPGCRVAVGMPASDMHGYESVLKLNLTPFLRVLRRVAGPPQAANTLTAPASVPGVR